MTMGSVRNVCFHPKRKRAYLALNLESDGSLEVRAWNAPGASVVQDGRVGSTVERHRPKRQVAERHAGYSLAQTGWPFTVRYHQVQNAQVNRFTEAVMTGCAGRQITMAERMRPTRVFLEPHGRRCPFL